MAVISRVGFLKSSTRKLSDKIKQSFSFLTCLAVALQPMMVELAYAQEIIIDPNGNVGFAPTVQRTSRPQVVDIATPNFGGVSHNRYERNLHSQIHLPISSIVPPYNYQLRTGTVAPAFSQAGGGTQYQAIGDGYLPDDSFINPRPLE